MCLQGGTSLRRGPTEVSEYILWVQEGVPKEVKVLLLAHTSCQTALECARWVGKDDLHIVSGCCPAVLKTCLWGMQGWAPHISGTFPCGSKPACLCYTWGVSARCSQCLEPVPLYQLCRHLGCRCHHGICCDTAALL